jgi:predicted esterase
VLISILAGCAVPQPQIVPHDFFQIQDKEFNREYYVYLPSSYGKRPLPLVVTCHGTNPWDSARMQINEWKYLAEHHDFVVVAPEVKSARGFIPPTAGEGISILQEDEKFIFKVIERFRNNINIDSRAIMITGWSAGGFPAYFVGLRHPDLFRCIAARQANFIREYYTPELGKLDPWQPILVFYGENDMPILKADSKVAYSFLRRAGQKNLFLQSMNVGHTRHPEVAVEFFFKSIKMYPHPAIRSARLYADGKCRIVFDSGLVNPPNENKIYWDFGDGESADGRVVEHVYEKPGTYELAVMHDTPGKMIRFLGKVSVDSGTMTIKPGPEK